MIKLKSITPMFNHILTTAERYEEDVKEHGVVVIQKGSIKEYQKVISVGSTVRGVTAGDMVQINPSRYSQKKHQEGSLKDGIVTDNPVVKVNFPTIELVDEDNNPQECLYIYDQDVDFVINEWVEVEDKGSNVKILIPDNKIMV